MKVITLVGTSLFENFFHENRNSGLKPQYEALKKDLPFNKNISESRISCLKSKLKQKVGDWAKDKSDASAEIKSLLKIKEELGQDKIDVHLLATDTIVSPLAAEIIKDWFGGKEGFEINFEEEYGKDVIRDLQVGNGKRFEEKGLVNLFKRIQEIAKKPEDTVFNITGGYKAIVPFLTFYAQLYKIPVYYIFEESNDVIKLPQLPIEVDFAFIEEYFLAFESIKPEKTETNLPSKDEFLKYLANDKSKAEEIFKELEQEKLITNKNGKICLTIFGELIYEKFFKTKATNYEHLKGTFVELRLFEYFYKKHSDEQEVNVYHSKEFEPYEADVLIENKNENTVTVIEVKPGGNVPFKNIKEKKIKGLLPMIKKAYKGYKLIFELYLYHKTEILKILKGKMDECNRLANEIMGKDLGEIKWYWLKFEDELYDAKQSIKNTHINPIPL